MNFEINLAADDNFEVPIKYSTIASHLPPSAESTNKKIKMLSNITRLGTRIAIGHVCYSLERCTEGKCKGTVIILRESDDSILWQCDRCMTKGLISDIQLIPAKDRKLRGPISLVITSREYKAADNIRGLPSEAHTMIMTPYFENESAVILSGSEEGFSELSSTIMEELDYELGKKSDEKHLFSLMSSIDDLLDTDKHII
jgi:hypothetical protein